MSAPPCSFEAPLARSTLLPLTSNVTVGHKWRSCSSVRPWRTFSNVSIGGYVFRNGVDALNVASVNVSYTFQYIHCYLHFDLNRETNSVSVF